jgi:hypothetical protein
MDEDRLNLEIRKFLKRFGVTSQREVEKAVLAAVESGRLAPDGTVPVHATIAIPGVLDALRIDGQLALAGPPSPDAG